MISSSNRRLINVGLAFALSLTVLLALTACGSSNSATTTPAAESKATGTASAKGSLPAAKAALSTMAPDAKLLVVQNPSPITSSTPPVWAYLFGSPKTGKTYVVSVQNGKTQQATEYGTTGLSAAEWAKVPSTDEWKIDSPEAYTKAETVAKAKTWADYSMGMVMYIPASETTSTTKPLTWYVLFDPTTSQATTGTVLVSATTGEIVKP